MAVILTQHDISQPQSPTWTYWLYNGLDCCLTREVHDVLIEKLAADEDAARCYAFERAIQAPAMCMMQRGILVDETARKDALHDLEILESEKTTFLQELATPFWDRKVRRKDKCSLEQGRHLWPRGVDDGDALCKRCGIYRLVGDGPNPRSVPQIKHLCYTLLSLPLQTNKQHKISVDDECLKKLQRKFPEHYDLLEAILECRRVRKQISLLNSRPDGDGRWRASFNVGATEVDRWSSSKSPFRTGTNFQNIADRSRNIFVADPGMMLFYADLSTAESRVIAYDAEDEEYIKAHESAYDVHTLVAMMCWPDLEWPGWETNQICEYENHNKPELKNGVLVYPKKHMLTNKCFAEQPTSFDPHHDYRLYAKKVQHGGNIGMSHIGIARELHIPESVAKEVVLKLDTAFPRRKARQRELINEVRTTGAVRTFLGRRRQFFERLWDSSTHREALAQTQQSSIGWLLNAALWRVWYNLDTCISLDRAPSISDPNKVWLLAQVHDAILGQVREGDFDTLREVRSLMSIPLPIRGRVCRIPVDVAYGKTWRHSDMQKLED